MSDSKVALFISGGYEKGYRKGEETLVNLVKSWNVSDVYVSIIHDPDESTFTDIEKHHKDGYKIVVSGIPLNSLIASLTGLDIIEPEDINKKDPPTMFEKYYLNKKSLMFDVGGIKFECLPIYHPLYTFETSRPVNIHNQVLLLRSYLNLTPRETYKKLYSCRSYSDMIKTLEMLRSDDSKYVSYDVETNYLSPVMKEFEITGFSLAFDSSSGLYVVLDSSDFTMSQEERSKCLELLKDILTDNRYKIIVHNLKMEVPATLNNLDYEIPEEKIEDTLVWSKLINSGRTGGNGLKEQAIYRLGYSDWSKDIDKIQSIKGEIKKEISSKDRKGNYKVDINSYESVELEELVKKYYQEDYKDVCKQLIEKLFTTDNIYSFSLIPSKMLERYGAIDAISTFELYEFYLDHIKSLNEKYHIDMNIGYDLWLESQYASYLLELNSSRWDENQASSDERRFRKIMSEDLSALLCSDSEDIRNRIKDSLSYKVLKNMFDSGEFIKDIENSDIFEGYTGSGRIRYRDESGKVKNIVNDKYSEIMDIFKLSKNKFKFNLNMECERLVQERFKDYSLEELSSILNPDSDIGKKLIMGIIQDDIVKSSKFILDVSSYITSETYNIDVANKEYNQGEMELIDLIKLYNPNSSPAEKFELYERIMNKLSSINLGPKLSRMIVSAGSWKMETLDEANMTELYNLYMIAGYDIDKDHNGDSPFSRLFHVRRYKKTNKLVTTYINGSKLGRSQVYVVDKDEFQSGKKMVKRKRQYTPGEVIKEDEDLVFQGTWSPNSVLSGRWSSGIHCLAGETKVRMLDGTDRSMKEMFDRFNAGEDQHVISITDDKKWVVAKVSEVLLSGYVDKVAKVHLDNGEIITSTVDHRFLGRDNNYYQAKDLEGMSMMPYYEKLVDGRRSVCHIDTVGSTFLYHLSKDYIMKRDGIEYRRDLIAHHIDKNHLNDDPSNIEILDRSTHLLKHSEVSSAGGKGNKGKKLSEERRLKMSEAQKSSKFNDSRRKEMIKRNKDSEYQLKCRMWTKTEEGKKVLSERAERVNEYINNHRPDILKKRSDAIDKRNKEGVMADSRCKSSLRKAYDILEDKLNWESYERVRKDIRGSLRGTIEKRLGELNSDEMIEVAKTYNHKVVKVEIVELTEKIPVYDLHINNETPCFVLSCGIVSHNTLPAWSDPKRYLSSRFKGGCSVIADFSQAEIRVVARASNEENLLNAYKNGEDVHMKTAMNIFRKPANEISEVERRYAKMSTFHILYGGDPSGFAHSYLNGDVAYANKIFEGFYGGYPKLKKFQEDRKREVESYGLITTMTNRYVFLGHEQPGVSVDKIIRQSGNAPIQGASSDIAASAVYNISKFIEDKHLKSKLYCFIH